MALVSCSKCRGLGSINGMGYLTRKCNVCEGSGEVSDRVTLSEVVSSPGVAHSKLDKKSKPKSIEV